MSSEVTIFTTGLSATKTAYELVKALRQGLAKPEVNTLDINDALMQLQGLVMDAQKALGDAEDENRRLRRDLDKAQHPTTIEADLVWETDGGFWVRKSEREKGINIPYCPTCWGTTSKLVPMSSTGLPGAVKCSIHSVIHWSKDGLQAEEQRKRQKEADENYIEIIPRRRNPWQT
jgi:hypothetical protein